MTAYKNNSFFSKSNKTQTGVATTVFIMLVGLAVTATGTGAINSVQSNQQKQIAINAVTHAQTGVWVGAEAFRLYLSGLDADAINDLSGDLNIPLNSSYGNVEARNLQVENMTAGIFRVSANIINVHSVAQSSAALNVVYEINPDGTSSASSASEPPITAVDFNDDLTLSGNLTLIGEGGAAFNLRINGDLDLENASVTTLETIHATGKVTLGSRVEVEHIYANDDVDLSNTIVSTVRTLGEFYADGSAAVDQLWANGNVTVNASGRFGSVHTLKNVDISGYNWPGHGYFNAGESIRINAGPVERVEAVGDITHTVWTPVDHMVSMGDISCVQPGWNQFISLEANGSLNDCNSSGSTQSGASNTVTPMAPLEPFTFEETVVDVWTLRDIANYIVEYDDAKGRIKVTVNNVNGISSGSEYLIGNYNDIHPNYKDYLCDNVDASGNCLTPSEPLMPLCIGQSLYNGCLSYNPSTETFTMNPNTSAPGIMWFDGNLELGNSVGMTTYLATGNIRTGNAFGSWSANFAGYEKVCLANSSHINKSAHVTNRYTQEFSAHYPSNLCDIENSVYLPNGTGNIALAAGGYAPDDGGAYSGGNIELSGSTEISGAVLAGNLLKTGGKTVVYGLITSSAKGAPTSEGIQLGANTTVDLSRGTDVYNPVSIPDMGTEEDGNDDSNATTEEPYARMLWVRYL